MTRAGRSLAAALAALITVAVLSCETPSPPRVETPPQVSADAEAGASTGQPAVTTAATSAASTTDAGSGTAAADGCASLAAQFDAAAAAAGGTCARDTDCACFAELRLDNQTGISDAKSATELGRLSAAYRGQHCPTVDVLVAGEPACKARCKAGHCR